MPAWIGQGTTPYPTWARTQGTNSCSGTQPTWITWIRTSTPTSSGTHDEWMGPYTNATGVTTTCMTDNTMVISSPSIWSNITQWVETVAPRRETVAELLKRDQQLYQKALREHDQQEAVRLRRQIVEREQKEAARLHAVAEADRKRREERARRQSAHDRAQQFLLDHLTPQQQETYTKNGWFIVEGGKTKTRYRIRSNTLMANVDVMVFQPGSKVMEQPSHKLCGHIPSDQVPLGDHLLAQKMMLEFSEDDFLRLANRHP